MIQRIVAGMLLVCLLLWQYTVRSQEPFLSLEAAWRKALEHYPGMVQQAAGVRMAVDLEKQVKAKMLPQAQLQLQNTYGSFNGINGAFFPQPGFYNVNVNSRGASFTGAGAAANSFTSLTAQWTFFQFGKQRSENRAARQQVQLASARLTAYQLTLRQQVTQRYFEVLYNREKLRWINKSVARVYALFDLSVTLADAGLQPGADTLLAAASYLHDRSEEDRWQGLYNASLSDLYRYTGPLDSTPVFPERYLSEKTFLLPADSVQVSHPFLDIPRQEHLYAIAGREAAGRSMYPSLALLGAVNAGGTAIGRDGEVSGKWTDGFHNGGHNYLVGIGLQWNIGGIQHSLQQKQFLEDQAAGTQAAYDETSLELTTQLQAAGQKLTGQLAQIQKTRQALQKATAAYESYLARYNSGLISLTELLQIEQLLQQTENIHLEAFHALWDTLTERALLINDFSLLARQFGASK